jgi:hypothetical protein
MQIVLPEKAEAVIGFRPILHQQRIEELEKSLRASCQPNVWYAGYVRANVRRNFAATCATLDGA